jgi:hypothetical protein
MLHGNMSGLERNGVHVVGADHLTSRWSRHWVDPAAMIVARTARRTLASWV